jgi:hypothetical protein
MSRRAPSRRNVEYLDQRQSRQLQSMAPGAVAGRLASASPPPPGSYAADYLEVDGDPGATAFARDRFPTGTGTLPGTITTATLTFTPLDNSLHLYLNPSGWEETSLLDEGLDYTLAGNVVTFTGVTPAVGDVVDARYAYDGVPIDALDETPTELEVLQTATAHGNGSTTTTFDAPTTAGSLLIAVLGGRWKTGISFPAGWVMESTVIRADSDYEVTVWAYPNAPATTSVTVTDDFINESQLTLAELDGFGPSPTITQVGYLVTPFTDGDTLTAGSASTDVGLALLGWSSRNYSGYDATGFGPADVSDKKAMLLTRPLTAGETVATDVTTGGGSNALGGVAISMLYVYDD